MKLPDAVIDKLQDGESPVTHAAIIEGVEMIIRYTCDGKVIGQTMFHYTPETYLDWFRSMMNEMNPEKGGSVKKKKLSFAESARPLVPLGQIERILEDVSHGVAGETGVAIRRSQSNTATNQTAARSTKLTQQRFELRKSSGHYRISSD